MHIVCAAKLRANLLCAAWRRHLLALARTRSSRSGRLFVVAFCAMRQKSVAVKKFRATLAPSLVVAVRTADARGGRYLTQPTEDSSAEITRPYIVSLVSHILWCLKVPAVAETFSTEYRYRDALRANAAEMFACSVPPPDLRAACAVNFSRNCCWCRYTWKR